MKRILFCTLPSLTKSLGAAKVVLELAEEMKWLGWECCLISLRDLAAQSGLTPGESLRRYLRDQAGEFDVVDYDHEYLPYPRDEFSPKTLFVARSVLLVHHLETIPIPLDPRLRAKAGAMLRERSRRQERRDRVCSAQTTLEAADLINVSNDDDRSELIRRGIPANKILVLPYGINRQRRPLFDRIPSAPPQQPTVAFVGTFDYRKGAREFPEIVQAVALAVPEVRFKLLGAQGLFRTEAGIKNAFPRRLHSRLDITLTYAPEELPDLLADCSLGLFPSYMEGFPFGVLEMLAASVPVIAYDSPGPPMMLPTDQLVRRGDWHELSRKLISLLQNETLLTAKRMEAKERSQEFDWKTVAERTHSAYWEACRS
jgi:glycosyltransferase involved in cell wall biosynthesis